MVTSPCSLDAKFFGRQTRDKLIIASFSCFSSSFATLAVRFHTLWSSPPSFETEEGHSSRPFILIIHVELN
jgi:hypothetical protein